MFGYFNILFFQVLLISAAVQGQGGGAGDPPCKPCQNVTEGSLQGMYYHNKAVISEQCDCVYNGPAGQLYCLQPEGLYTTTTCTDDFSNEFDLPKLDNGNYTETGKVVNLEDLQVYVAQNGTRCIVWNYDIAGFDGSRSRQLCDYFSAQGFTVIMPDYFRGYVFIPGVSDPAVFFSTTSNWTNIERDWEKVKAYGSESLSCTSYGAMGTCWGSYPVIRLSTFPDFKAGVSMHPSHPGIMAALQEDEAGIYAQVKSPQLIMPSKSDSESVKLGGLAEKTLKEVRIREFNEMEHGWTTRGNLSDPAVDRDVHAALGEAINFFNKHIQ